jgi:hypothetical protein
MCIRQVFGNTTVYNVQFDVTASDPDGDTIIISPSASSTPSSTISSMSSETVNSGNSTTFSFTAQSSQSLAEISISGTVSDGVASSQIVQLKFKPASSCF